MIDVYLATGFLGSGKTNFLKCFLSLFPDSGTAVIVNEFGKEGVDGFLLSELGNFMAEINNGSIFCSCKLVQFEDTLQEMIGANPARIVIEASGLSDPTTVRDVLGQPRFSGKLRYAGGICIIDAARFFKLWSVVRVIKQQIAVGDLFLVNKTDLASDAKIEETLRLVGQMRPGVPVVRTTYARITREELSLMNPERASGTEEDPGESLGGHLRDLTLRKLTLEVSVKADSGLVRHGISLFADDAFRVKGLLTLQNGQFLVDCVGPHLSVTPYTRPVPDKNRLVVLYDRNMPARKSIEKAMQWLPEGTFRIEAE